MKSDSDIKDKTGVMEITTPLTHRIHAYTHVDTVWIWEGVFTFTAIAEYVLSFCKGHKSSYVTCIHVDMILTCSALGLG